MTSHEGTFSYYLGAGAIKLALVLAVLPNLFFLLIEPMYIVFRLFTPCLYLLAGLVSFRAPKWVTYLLFFLTACFDLFIIVSVAFHLGLKTTFQSIKYVTTLNIGASLFYIFVVSVVVLGAFFSAYVFNKNKQSLKSASPLLATVTALCICGINYFASFHHLRDYNGPIDSALLQTHMSSENISAQGRNLLIVMVEGMGAYKDPRDRQILQSKMEAVAEQGRFSLETGVSFYQGSTTGAASRELCGRWGEHTDYMGGDSYDCLPWQLAERGYVTSAFHGFDQDMFQRDLWYPKIGFDNLFFKTQLEALPEFNSDGYCGSVFTGLCDVDVGLAVKSELLKPSVDPQMIYWLTLNSHIPFVPKDNGALSCGTGSAKIDRKLVCDLTELWSDIFDITAEIATDPGLPPTDILIIGDHHTPIWDRAAKRKFIPNQVDWYLLRDSRSVKPEI